MSRKIYKRVSAVWSPVRATCPFREFVIGLLFFATAALGLIANFPPETLVLSVNRSGTLFLDSFFRLYTHLGLGVVLIPLALVFLFIRFYYSILVVANLLASGVIVFVFKKLIFNNVPRPMGVLQPADLYRFIEGVEFHQWGSFPSGHTLTAFMGAAVMALAASKRGTGYVLLLIAALVGFSRIYLLQHFTVDVLAGALIGVATVWLLHTWLSRYEKYLNNNLSNLLFRIWKSRRRRTLIPQM